MEDIFRGKLNSEEIDKKLNKILATTTIEPYTKTIVTYFYKTEDTHHITEYSYKIGLPKLAFTSTPFGHIPVTLK